MTKEEIKSAIEHTIRDIEVEYRRSKGLILTEDDLMSIIFTRLSTNYPGLIETQQTNDVNISAPMLHTELSWFDENGKLTIKPDITILDPQYLSILKGGGGIKLPSKQYSFSGDAILLELKFVRNKTGITDRVLSATGKNTIKGDVAKIKRLFQRLEDQHSPYSLFCYFVIFNKTDRKSESFLQLLKTTNQEGEGKYMMLYGTGDVQL